MQNSHASPWKSNQFAVNAISMSGYCAQVTSARACDVAWEGDDDRDRLCGKEIAAPRAKMLLHKSEQCARVGA